MQAYKAFLDHLNYSEYLEKISISLSKLKLFTINKIRV